jgi:hypothetical protein
MLAPAFFLLVSAASGLGGRSRFWTPVKQGAATGPTVPHARTPSASNSIPQRLPDSDKPFFRSGYGIITICLGVVVVVLIVIVIVVLTRGRRSSKFHQSWQDPRLYVINADLTDA